MKHKTFPKKTLVHSQPPAYFARVGPEASALMPPSYGIDLLDRSRSAPVEGVNDPYERDAERVAEQVVGAGPSLQRSPAGGQANPRRLQSACAGGSALTPAIQAEMEGHFNSDFSDVRVHTGEQAAQMSQNLNAAAFTHGSNIYFNRGRYNPASRAGKRLLAHELAHTVQQRNTAAPTIQLQEIPGAPSLPSPTGTFSMRLREDGRIEFIAGTPDLPAVGSLGIGMRCENGRCRPIAGQNPFFDPSKDSYTFQEALDLLRGFGNRSSSPGPGSLVPLPTPGGNPGAFPLPCQPGWTRDRFGICHPNLSPYPGLRSPGGSLTLTPPLPPAGASLGDLRQVLVDQFSQNSAVLPDGADRLLQPLVADINALSANGHVYIEGHASTEGTPERNMTLSRERANAVRDRLVHLGVTDAGRFGVSGHGETQPLVTADTTEAARRRNRRVEVWFFTGTGTTFRLPSLRPPSLLGP